MSLRLRLVVSLVVLFAVGLLLFGLGTIQVFSRAEFRQLDRQLDSAAGLVEQALRRPALSGLLDADGDGRAGDGGGRGAAERRAPVTLAPGTWAELRDADGVVVARRAFQTTDDVPDLTGVDGPGTSTVGSLDGTTRWRVLARGTDGDGLVVVAVPTAVVGDAVRRLLLIELAAGSVLLLVMAGGGALLLRRGLQPLEEIAAATSGIDEGRLDLRVPHADEPAEVGQLAAALNLMLDDLERSFAEREATEARLRRFIADASHELRTPLTSIRGFAELFRLGADSEHVDLDTAMRRIEEESARMGRLVEDLLALARFDDGVAPATGPVDLSVVAADACSDAVAADPSRAVRLDAPESLVVVAADDQVRQAVTNLVANALRHTPDGTAVDVSVRRDGELGVVVVRDHGPGLGDDALVHGFDRFWQADRARVGTGVGLGLAITSAIAAAHGGDVQAANHPDGGAEMTLRLPVAGPVRGRA